MNLLAAEVKNFGSYKKLKFDFKNQGLALIYGSTGSGKSTLQDIASWCLYGVSSKNGSVDEIRSWESDGEPTSITLEVQLKQEVIKVTRVRGKPSENDLYWETSEGALIRGKDLNDTQRLLEQKLEVSADLYLTAACYNEFSPTSSFFISKAKDRRELFEKIAPLSFVTDLMEIISEAKKESKKPFVEAIARLNTLGGQLDQLHQSENQAKRDASKWEENKARKINELKVRSEKFHEEKQSKIASIKLKSEVFKEQTEAKINNVINKLKDLEVKINQADKEKCPTCGNNKHPIDKFHSQFESNQDILADLVSRTNVHQDELKLAEALENKYDEQLIEEESAINPFNTQLEIYTKKLESLTKEREITAKTVDNLNKKINGLASLQTALGEMRAAIINKSIQTIQDETNRYLETYFDSEFKITFEANKSDNLDVIIRKNGNLCSYTQLSKGQRSLLKLSFAISVMTAASNSNGVHFDTLLFDEALDGLDTDLKIKAFNLFCELETRHQSIFVIDHDVQLQSLFSKKYHVSLKQDESIIEYE